MGCLFGTALFLASPTHGQLLKLPPRLSGQRYVETTGGLAPVTCQGLLLFRNSGWHGALSTGVYDKKLNAWKWTVGYVRKPQSPMATDSAAAGGKVQQFTVGYGKELVLYKSVFRTFLVRGLAQPYVGLEVISGGHQPMPTDAMHSSRTRVLAGADLSLEVEFQPVVLGIRQRWSPTSGVGQWGTLAFVGVRVGW